MMAFSADEFIKYNEYSHYDTKAKVFVDDNYPKHTYIWDDITKESNSHST